MIKREKSGMCDPGGPPGCDERLVIAYKPTRQVATGPYDWLMAKRTRARLNPEFDAPLVWVNGRFASAEVFGEWFDRARTSFPAGTTVYFIFGDQSKFEAHRCEGSFNFTKEIAFTHVKDEMYRQARKASRKLRGRAQRLDIKYSVEWKLGSGGTETSLDSVTRSAGGLVHAFGEPVWGTQMFAVNGDDWLIITRLPPNEAGFHQAMTSIGFESSFASTTDITEVTFCQTAPYQTSSGTVWGPLIGRVLSRLPWSIETSKEDPRGVALGMRVACAHIPFLSDYLRRIADLSTGVRAIEYRYHLSAERSHSVDSLSSSFVLHRYGLTDDDLRQFRALLDSAPCLRTVLNWPHLERIAAIDA
jgi:hypothetical protein